MNLNERIEAFSRLGKNLSSLPEDTLSALAISAANENPWFIRTSVEKAIRGICAYLESESLNQWTSVYKLDKASNLTVAVIAAGNIPLVGFHDMLSVLIAGHKLKLKPSSKDNALMKCLIEMLIQIEPRFNDRIYIVDGKLDGFDAVIATGSDNTSRYFDYYFGKYPHIIRRNRTSCAILNGHESPAQLERLGDDVFSYFGLGCRNVSKLFLPAGYDPTTVLKSWDKFDGVINHHKYANNYDYQKSILLVNQMSFLDSGFVLLQESPALVSPISVLYYEFYHNNALDALLEDNAPKLQCIVGEHPKCDVAFGESQSPALWDYADKVDTLRFLSALN